MSPLLLTLAAVTACGDIAGPPREISGERIFNRNCARCHGVDGRGTPEAPSARDLSNRAYMDSLGDDHIRRVIKGGVPPGMPAFREQFMRPSLDALVAYTRSLSSDPRPRAATAPGASSKEVSIGPPRTASGPARMPKGAPPPPDGD